MHYSNPNIKIDEVVKQIQASSVEMERLIRECPKIFANYHRHYAKAFITAKNGGQLPDGTVLAKLPSDEVAKQVALANLPDSLVEEYYSAKISMELTVEVARNLRRTADALRKGANEADSNEWAG